MWPEEESLLRGQILLGMFSRLSGLANTVLHELSGDGEGSENVQDPVAESGTLEKMSEDQMETLAHYEQLVIQLKELIQQKDAEIQHKDTELQQKETQLKLEKEASDAKIGKLKLQAKAKLATLNKQIEGLKKAATNQVPPDGNQAASSTGQKETLQSVQNNEESTSKLQENINELTRQLHDSQKNISELTKQHSESQETITTLTHQLQDSQENVTDLKRALQESGDAARELHKQQETEIRNFQRKLEEQSKALGSRTQVVQMLEQELQNAELQKQVLSEQYREMERELLSQKESAQQTMMYKEMLQDKDNAYQMLQEELDKERSINSQLQSLRAEVKRGMQAQEEQEQIKKELEMEKEARKRMEEARQELDIKVQDDIQQFRAQLERGVQEELETLRAELDKEKRAQQELEQLRSELEKEKGAQEEELSKLRSELGRSKEVDEEVQQLRAELDDRKESQEELSMELERLKSINDLLMEKEKGGQQDADLSTNETDDLSVQLENVRSELKNGKESQEELSRLKEELERVKESLADFDQVKDELEKGQETLLKLDLMKQEFQKLREAEILVGTMQQEIDKQKLETVKEPPQQVSGTDTDIHRNEFTQQKAIIDEDRAVNVKETDGQNDGDVAVYVKETFETHRQNYAERDEAVNLKEAFKTDGQNDTDGDEALKVKEGSETDGQNDADGAVSVKEGSETGGQKDTDAEEAVNVKEGSETGGQKDTDANEAVTLKEGSETGGQNYTDEDEAQNVKKVSETDEQNDVHTAEELPQLSDASFKTQFKEECLDTHMLLPLEDHVELVHFQSEQMLHSSIVEVQSHSVSQELVVDVAVEDLKEKQLSILMLDLVDTQEEINRLKGQLNVEQESFSSRTTLVTQLTENLEEVRNLEECSDSDIQSLKEQVKELKFHLEVVTSEKNALTLKLQDLVQEQRHVERLESSELQNKHLPDYESQNILAEQVNSLENESKSKDIKITAVQKDLDDMNLLLSEQNTISKLQENQLEENKKNAERLKELLNLSQSKEERLSEALAANERDIVALQDQLSQKTAEMEILQHSFAEKEQQVSEVSHSFSDKVVLLNEEKFSLVKEIKALKEQLKTVVQQSGKEEESLENLRIDNAELNLQKEMITQEKSDLQEILKSTQTELGEVKTQLEDVSSRYMHSQEIFKTVQEESEMLHVQMEDQRSGFLFKQKELEELQIQVENHKHTYEKELQLLTEKHQSSLNDISCLQEEKRDLEHQLKYYINRLPEDDGEAGLKEKEELQIQVENRKKEVEQLKRKLQAALVSRKELTKKVSKLEEALVKHSTDKGLDPEVILAIQNSNLKSEQEVVSKDITGEFLKRQQVSLGSELEHVRRELNEKSAANEQLQILTDELKDKSRHVESLAIEPIEGIASEKSDSPSSPLNTEENANMVLQLENRIMQLEQDKENLHKKVQEALNSRRDTIKKAQEKDRHHREQLKQQKEEFNLLQEKLEKLQKDQKSVPDTDRILEERAMQTEIPYSVEKQSNDSSHRAECLIPVNASQDSSDKSNWREEWVDFLPEKIEDTLVHKSPSTDMSLDSCKIQLDLLQSQKNELQLKALQLEENLDERLVEVSHLRDTIEYLTTQLQQEKDKCQGLETQASVLKAEIEKNKQEMSHLQEFTIKSMKDEMIYKGEEVRQLHQELEERNIDVKNANELISEKDCIILSLKSQMEFQTKDYEERCKKLEVKVQEVQQKQDNDDVEGEKGKQQLQRKLQAALISRKDALKESKALKLELETMRAQKQDSANRLQVAEGLTSELNLEKETLLNALSAQKEERDKLIMEIDKCLLENQNLEASCESLKLALVGITQDKEDLNKDLGSLKMSHDSKKSEWQDKMSDLQKEYETLLQSYENVSDETDRMKRAVEMVKQEKQELFTKMKSIEGKKKEVENELEESQMEIENMKEKMRKFAKSKQQKILELEEENDRLRGELHQSTEVQKSGHLQEDDAMVKGELTRVQTENNVLILELEQVKSEKENLTRESDALKLQLHSVELDLQKVLEERSTEILEKEVLHKSEAIELTHSVPEHSDKLVVGERVATLELLTENDEKQKTEKISQLEEVIEKLENDMKAKENETEKMNKIINAFQEEKLGLDALLSSSQDVITNIEKDLADLKNKYQTAVHDLDEANNQKQALEIDKDELEERLMNQMAELNGSIGNFQQDALDLQFKNESLQQKLEDLQLQLEEERRQMERQKAEALSGVHKEYVEKLKSVHEGEKGRKTQSKELQELLKEKQQEVRHLQKDCIQYQETISQLERTFKALEFVHGECEKEKVASSDRVAKAVADTKKAQADLTSLHVLLDDTQSEAARVLAENVKIKKEIQIVREDVTLILTRKEEDTKNKLEEERAKNLKEIVNLQAKISLLQHDKVQLEGSLKNLQDHLEEKSQQMRDIQGNLNQNIAKLAAFTRSMCSLQDDRDRVIEESKKWNGKFNDELQKKDDEIRVKEKICMDLKNELLQVTSQVDELKAHVSRVQLENEELVTAGQIETESLAKARDSLLEEKAILSSCLQEEQKMHCACQEELNLRSQEAKDRLSQLESLNIEVTQLKNEKENLLDTIQTLEAEVQDLKLHNEQTQSDLQASKSLTEQLHKELEQKEQDVMRLLSAHDEAVSAAVGELNEMHAIQCRALEERLEEAENDRKRMQSNLEELKTRLKANQEEANQSKAQLQAFTKSMCSLQEERERVLNDYQQLEQRHLDAILAKDGLIQEAAAESNKLREELRFLRSRSDDLNAQNAKLNAQLTRYRKDLNEVISLKDSQLKQLLGEKLLEIEKLRIEQNTQELLLNHEKGQIDALQQELDETKKEKQRSLEQVDSLTHCISELQTENETLRNKLKQVEQEAQMLKDELLQGQKELESIKEEALRIQADAEKRMQHAEDELNKKLQSIQHDTGILRNETETAEERVAELARDLLEAEQRLLNANEENSSLKAQIQAFGGSMRSLQDSHDIAQEEIKNLQNQLKEVLAFNEDLGLVQTERDNLNVMLSESKEEQQRIQIQLKELVSNSQVREEELRRVTADFQASQMQLRNLSKAMGSLQEDRDRLQSSLKTPPREIERTLQSSYQRDSKNSSDHPNSSLLENLQSTQAEMQNLRTELGDTIAQVHQKELRIEQLNVKLSQIFEEKNYLSLQLHESNQILGDAMNRCSSLEQQLNEMLPKSSVRIEALLSDSAPGAPQERKEPQNEADQQLMELQHRYMELKQQSTEHEHVRSVLEQQLREERRRAEDRIQELEENMNRLGTQDWSVQEESVAPHELSLLMEPHDAPNVKARSSSLKRLLRLVFCSRTKTPLLASLYLLLIHALLLLCLTGHL
ncbi:PREDICTED: golgin subfamily B member 1 [Nanorana parkeri]|uniref:golgin subfamily B member 1 n=1 Tax=Nanorana parkeri TaxID=125878 RepID=UPI000854B9BE|nr:PREDICTED: golgin subfamily B member 1 [Nanorana parkeri]